MGFRFPPFPHARQGEFDSRPVHVKIDAVPTGNTEIGDAFGTTELVEVRVVATDNKGRTVELPFTLWLPRGTGLP